MFKINKNTLNMKAIKGARSTKEIKAILAKLAAKVKTLVDSSEDLLESVSSNSRFTKISISTDDIREATDFRKGGRVKPPSSARIPSPVVNLTNVKHPDLKQLISDSKELEEMSQIIEELRTAELRLLDGSLTKFPAKDPFLKQSRALIQQMEKGKSARLRAMSLTDKQHRPKQHVALIKGIQKHIGQLLSREQFSSIKPKYFITHPDKETLHYQTYITIKDLENDDGFIYPNYTLVVTGVLNMPTGHMVHHITSIKEVRIPGTFDIGKPADRSSKIKQRINALLSLDQFLSKHDRLKIDTNSRKRLKKANLSDFVETVKVRDETIFVKLKPSITESEEATALPEIRSMLNLITGGKNTTMQPKKQVGKSRRGRIENGKRIRGKKGGIWYQFRLVPTQSGKELATARRLNRIQEDLNLSNRVMDEIRDAIKFDV